MNIYKQMLETIIEEMNGVLAKGANPSIDSEYSQWLNFLRQIHPDSALLKNQGALSDTDFSKEPRTLAQISEVVECAASEHYPIWRIQPKYVEAIVLEYERGKLKGECRDMGAPEMIEGFNGRVRGAVTDEGQFIAVDMDRCMDFSGKMGFLENAGFTVSEFIQFETEKIRTTSREKLEIHIQNYISRARSKGLNVDGAIIISDTGIDSTEQKFSSTRIAYVPSESILTNN